MKRSFTRGTGVLPAAWVVLSLAAPLLENLYRRVMFSSQFLRGGYGVTRWGCFFAVASSFYQNVDLRHSAAAFRMQHSFSPASVCRSPACLGQNPAPPGLRTGRGGFSHAGRLAPDSENGTIPLERYLFSPDTGEFSPASSHGIGRVRPLYPHPAALFQKNRSGNGILNE